MKQKIIKFNKLNKQNLLLSITITPKKNCSLQKKMQQSFKGHHFQYILKIIKKSQRKVPVKRIMMKSFNNLIKMNLSQNK